jgi:hypothetical protein
MAKIITVVSGLPPNEDGSHRVALWEPHPDHPEDANGRHEAWVVGDTPTRVALTAEVAGALREGRLLEADAEGDPKDRPSAAVRAIVEPETPAEPGRPGRR